MKKVVVMLLLGLLLTGFASGPSYAEKGGTAVKGASVKMDERAGHEEGMPMMHGMRHRGMRMMRAGHRIRRALADLGLDEKQKESIRTIRTGARKDAIRKIADVRIVHLELRELLAKDPVDMGAVEAKLKQMESLKTDLHMSRIKTLEEIKSNLTPEQRQNFRANLKKHHGRHGGWRHDQRGKMPAGKKEKK
ncbi:MAG: Spy/CpxP family protein refolding chaperone [Thermodesulfovibrionales bacterium]